MPSTCFGIDPGLASPTCLASPTFMRRLLTRAKTYEDFLVVSLIEPRLKADPANRRGLKGEFRWLARSRWRRILSYSVIWKVPTNEPRLPLYFHTVPRPVPP